MGKNTFIIEVIFKRIEKITYIYKETRQKVDERLKSVNTNWTLAVTFTNWFVIEMKRSHLWGQQMNWNSIPQETVKEYWSEVAVQRPHAYSFIKKRDSGTYVFLWTLRNF